MKFVIGFWLALAVIAQGGGLKFSSLLTEVTAPPNAATVTADFPFTNNGDKLVSIAKTDPGCSCLKVEISGGKLNYAPGESGVVRATFEMGNFSGTVDKVVALWTGTDSDDKPSVHLTARVHIPVLVNLEPKTVKWDIGAKAASQTVEIRMADDQTIHVVGVTSSNPSFKLELKKITDGKRYDLVITPENTDRPAIAVIRIETDCAIARHKLQNAFAVIRKASTVEAAAAKP